MNKLLIGIILFTVGQALIWIQTNGQFINKWAKENPFWMAIIFAIPISYMFIYATKYIVEYFDGLLWPGRFIGFGTGMIIFSIFTYIFMGEGISSKTAISLVLATALVLIQILWK
tara:strand:+ start:406 stop:750 length:345 start_codon:yes stop_codon:yes gene_type:complete